MARDQEAPQQPDDDAAGRFDIPTEPSDSWGEGGAVQREDGADDPDRVNDWTWDQLDVHHPGFNSEEEYEANRDEYRKFLA